MKRVVVLIMAIFSICLTASGQSVETPAGNAANGGVAQASNTPVSVPKTDWLAPFTKVVVDGPIIINFKRVSSAEELKVVYDTKGSLASRFRAVVDKNGVLNISERFDSKQSAPTTEVTLYYKELDNIKIAHSTATFAEPVKATTLDVLVSGGAVVTLPIDTLDAVVECTGSSRMVLSGRSRYFKIDVSTAKINAFELETVSLNVNASHGAELKAMVMERLEAVTSTSAKLFYKGKPQIVRNRNSLFGGDIVAMD